MSFFFLFSLCCLDAASHTFSVYANADKSVLGVFQTALSGEYDARETVVFRRFDSYDDLEKVRRLLAVFDPNCFMHENRNLEL